MKLKEIDPNKTVRQSVSWTGKPVSYFLHTIDRTEYAKYVERQAMKNDRVKKSRTNRVKFLFFFCLIWKLTFTFQIRPIEAQRAAAEKILSSLRRRPTHLTAVQLRVRTRIFRQSGLETSGTSLSKFKVHLMTLPPPPPPRRITPHQKSAKVAVAVKWMPSRPPSHLAAGHESPQLQQRRWLPPL